jgi:hypothetical protein
MKVLEFRGKNIHYNSITELSKKLGIPPNQAKELTKKEENRILIDAQGHTGKIKSRDNFLPYLRREFGIKRAPNSVVFSKNPSSIKNIDIVKKLGPNARQISFVKVYMYLTWYPNEGGHKYSDNEIDDVIIAKSDGYDRRHHTFLFNGYTDEIERKAKETAVTYARRANAYLVSIQIIPLTFYGRQKMKWDNGTVYKANPIEVQEWSNVELNKSSDGNCAINYLQTKYGLEDADKLNINGGVIIKDLIEYLKVNKISCKIYDSIGNIRYEHSALADKNKICFMVYDNHFYPINGNELKQRDDKIMYVKIIKDSITGVSQLLKKKISPSKIKILKDKNGILINSFVVSNKFGSIKYIQNNEYLECEKILTKLNLEEYLTDNISYVKLFGILERKYLPENVNSFFPECQRFIKGGFNYTSPNKIDNSREISSIDKNKAYSHALNKLPFLISCDWRTAKITKKPENITYEYLYIVKPAFSSILLPDTNIYSGYHLVQCKKYGLQFELLEEITTEVIPNTYPIIIDKLKEHLPNQVFKDIMNINIGKMEKPLEFDKSVKLVGLLNKDESKSFDGHKKRINKEFNLIFNDEDIITGVYNRKPISVQVKDMARFVVFEKIIELGLNDSDIISIVTDAITYYGKLPSNLNNDKIDSWKEIPLKICEEKYGQIKLNDDRKVNEPFCAHLDNFVDNSLNENVSFFLKNSLNEGRVRKLYRQYAGAGKTTFILKEVIPQLKKQGKSFIVLTPSHASITEYRSNDIPCQVIQKYDFINSIPTEDMIIVDEIGMVDRKGNDTLFKISQTNKDYICFGDFNQLPPPSPVLQTYDSAHYTDYLYNSIDTKFINFRNNFTQEYYDSLINSTNTEFLASEMKKYSVKNFFDAEVIICYRNNTRKHYNNLMLQHLGRERYDIGNEFVCLTNRLMKYDIYNGKIVKIIDKDKKNIYLDDGNEIKIKRFKKNFDLTYAMTCYKVQGSSKLSYYWAPEDDFFITPRIAYTVISRLKENVKYRVRYEYYIDRAFDLNNKNI